MSAPWWFHHREPRFELGFTDARTDFGRGPGTGADPEGVVRRLLDEPDAKVEVALMRQVHGATVARAEPGATPQADALVVDRPGVAAVVRVADCIPIVVVADDASLGAVVHAGRAGMVAGVVTATVDELRSLGAGSLRAWLGPRACGSCYELPQEMVDEIALVEPSTRSVTSWGTPAVDVGAGVRAQLARAGVPFEDLGADVCTLEDERFWSHRRQKERAGRFGAVVRLLEGK